MHIFSNYGSREGDKGCNMKDLLVVLADVRYTRPTAGLFECVVPGTAGLIERYLGDIYKVLELVLSPHFFGVPNQRNRRYTYIALKEFAMFYGAADEFSKLFYRECTLDANVFFTTDPETRLKESRMNADARGNHYPRNIDHVPMHAQMTALSQSRFLEHMKLKEARSNEHGCFVFDIEQNANFCSSGWMLPPLCPKSNIVHGGRDIFLLANEHLVAMGEPIGDENNYYTPCTSFEDMSDPKKKILAGNAMSMWVAGTCLMYCLASTELVK